MRTPCPRSSTMLLQRFCDAPPSDEVRGVVVVVVVIVMVVVVVLCVSICKFCVRFGSVRLGLVWFGFWFVLGVCVVVCCCCLGGGD